MLTPSVRSFEPADAENISSLIRTTLLTSNEKDYPPQILKRLAEYFSPEKILRLNSERECLVAASDGRIVGTSALEAGKLATFFVHPDFQRKRIGSVLLAEVERLAREKKVETLTVASSVTGAAFYEKMGYQPTGTVKEETAGRQIEMKKRLY